MRMPQMDSHIRNISAASGQATGQPPTLPPLQNEQQLEIEKQWITEMIQVCVAACMHARHVIRQLQWAQIDVLCPGLCG